MSDTGSQSELELRVAQREGSEVVRTLLSRWSSEAREVAACAYDLGHYLELDEMHSRSRAIALEGWLLFSVAAVSENLAAITLPEYSSLKMLALVSGGVFALWGIGKMAYSEYYLERENQRLPKTPNS